MDIELLRKMAEDVAKSLNLRIYKVEFKDGEKGKELYVECDRPGFIDMDGIVAFSERYSSKLDKVADQIEFDYVLNCCSADPEREITGEDYSEYLDSYVEVIDDEGNSILGEIVATEDDKISLKTNNKGRIKIVIVECAKIKNISLRIKI